jgi:hypothetical protein
MFTKMRSSFGPLMVSGIIGFIAFVFIFSGVFSPKATRGLHEGSVAGKVNGESITLQEFNREYNRRMEFFGQLGGGKLSPAQLKAFRIREGVFGELVNRKLMSQAAVNSGLVASDAEVKEKIREMPAFQKDGKFDPEQYRAVLAANNYTPATFERLMREDLSLQQWGKYFKSRVQVSDEEVKQEFLSNNDKRNIKYVALTPENLRKGIKVSDDEVKKFLADPAKLNLAKGQYEGQKEGPYKGKSFDDVKAKIAAEILAGEKTEEIRKLGEKLAGEVEGTLTADKGGDARVNAALKPYGIEVKSTGLVNQASRFVPGVGETRELFADAFREKSPIDPKQGGKAKRYGAGGGWVVALVSDAQKPDLAKLEGERAKLIAQINARKERELNDAWLEKLRKEASIDKNPDVVNDDQEAAES